MTNASNRSSLAKRGLGRAALALVSLFGATVLSTACSSSNGRSGFEEGDKKDASDLPSASFTDGDASAEPLDAGDNGKCLSENVAAERVPLAMLVLIDRSGSMSGDKWLAATKAIRAFADRSEVVGMNMGLQFFPPLLTGDQCSASLYKTPAVSIAPLPDNVIPIQQKVDATNADGGATPMRSGLEGSIAAMRTFIQANSPHSGAIILVTDGDPNSCGGVSEVANVAAAGANPPAGVPRVATFAVGMQGATFSNLDQIAAAGGGAPKAFNVGVGAAAQQALLEALDTVRTSAIGCEYVLPTPEPSKGILDPTSVEVHFTPGKNDPTQNIKQVTSKDDCGATTGGYYYDDAKNPTRVILCPASCDAIGKATIDAKVELGLGCILKPN
ncbi:hypothetical protein AKJ09_05517 [Labilithrix luteola]|uniref:VWFA domain-containing protein n=1 Tax=Labilithrix luteola TaxID=1391654 RepID=A0A0K1PZA0_9BACT|nr:vWA domain-containing protein [Labilithrix luteola]AKU98853.1 hypothetical protein AKJ09_05517 [Labilithrix luteola]